MLSHLIVSKLLTFHSCICEWTNICLEETLLQIITELFPSICIEQGLLHQPLLGCSVNRGQHGMGLDLLISVAITVMLCHSNVSRSRSFDVKTEPFPEWMLNILSRSVCRSTEYLEMQNRIYKGFFLCIHYSHILKLFPEISYMKYFF